MEATSGLAASALVPVTLLTLTSLVALRRGLRSLANSRTRGEEVEEDEHVEGDEDLIPQPEPLGGVMAPTKRPSPKYAIVSKRSESRDSRALTQAKVKAANALPTFTFEKQRNELPLDLDPSALRAKLIDADAAKRRAMARLAELERETESLKRRCAELEMKVVVGDSLQSLTKTMSDSLQSLGMSQRLLAIAMPQLKYKGRSVMWKT